MWTMLATIFSPMLTGHVTKLSVCARTLRVLNEFVYLSFASLSE